MTDEGAADRQVEGCEFFSFFSQRNCRKTGREFLLNPEIGGRLPDRPKVGAIGDISGRQLVARELTTWWEAVCRREKPDARAAELMKVQLGKLDHVLQTLRRQRSPELELLAEVEKSRALLQSNWNEYRRQLGDQS